MARIAPPNPQLAQLTLYQARDAKKRKAIDDIDQLLFRLHEYEQNWMNGARIVGSAYRAADDNYNKAWDQKKISDAREIQLVFSLLTIGLTGGLGWMGAAAISNAGSKKLDEVILGTRDAFFQATAGEVSSIGPTLKLPHADTIVSQDPQKYQNDLQNKVGRLLRRAYHDLGDVREKYTKMMPEAWDTYDTYATKDFEAVFKDFQNMAVQLEGEDDLPDEDWMARELERGRWAKYVLDKHSSPWDVGNAVRDALARLRVADVWPEVVGASNPYEPVMPTVDFDTANRRVWNWAKNYEVRTFADENRHPKGGGPDHQ